VPTFAGAADHTLFNGTENRAACTDQHSLLRIRIGGFDDIECSIDDDKRKGCFLVNFALEIAPHDRKLRASPANSLARLGFLQKVKKGRPRAGRNPPAGTDAGDVSRLLLGVLLSIRVLARSNPNRTLL